MSYRSVAALLAGSAVGVMLGIMIVGVVMMSGNDSVVSWLMQGER